MCVGVIDQKIHKIGVDTIFTFYKKLSQLNSYNLIEFISCYKLSNNKLNNIKDNLQTKQELDSQDKTMLDKLISYMTLDFQDNKLLLKDTHFIVDTCYKLNIKLDLFIDLSILYLQDSNVIVAKND